MGSTVIVYRDDNSDKNTLWMPNSYQFVHTMEAMSNIIQSNDPVFSEELKLYRNHPLSYIDMSDWNSEKLNKFLEVVICLEKDIISKFIELQKSKISLGTTVGLKLLLNIDPRINGKNTYLKSGSIILDNDTKWLTSGWVYDCILVELLSFAFHDMFHGYGHKDKRLLSTIQSARQTGTLDMRFFNKDHHRTILGLMCNIHMFSQFGAIYGKNPEKLKSNIEKEANTLVTTYSALYPQHIHWWKTGEEI